MLHYQVTGLGDPTSTISVSTITHTSQSPANVSTQQPTPDPCVTQATMPGAPLQQLACQHAVQSVTASTIGVQQHIAMSAVDLNTEATPFIPSCPGVGTVSHHRPIEDILRDHSEVEKVLQGGEGTPSTVTGAWRYVGPQSPLSSESLSLPFTGSDIPSVFITPAKPVAKTNSLKEIKLSFNNKVFIDRQLPSPAKPLTAHVRFTPTYYVALHNLVASPGNDGRGFWYQANTPNYRGARIPLVHTGLNIINWRKHLTGYGDCSELLQFMEYGFPLGLTDNPDLSPCDRNHGSAYQFYPHIDKFVSNEITRGGLTGPFQSPPWASMMLSPLMTAPKKPDSRRPVFDATFGDKSLNNATPCDTYLRQPNSLHLPKA